MNGDDDYGTVKIGGRLYRMTGRGFVVWLVSGSVVCVGAVWLLLSVVIVALSPLYG